MDIAPGLIPGPESSGRDVALDALSGPALEGKFPVMNRSGAIGGQMRNPATTHQLFDNSRAAILHQVRAIEKNHAGAALSGGGNLLRALLNPQVNRLGAGRRRMRRVDQEVLDSAHALARGERKN